MTTTDEKKLDCLIQSIEKYTPTFKIDNSQIINLYTNGLSCDEIKKFILKDFEKQLKETKQIYCKMQEELRYFRPDFAIYQYIGRLSTQEQNYLIDENILKRNEKHISVISSFKLMEYKNKKTTKNK